ncbi:hypothetical protein [Pseudarthrobacter sp. ATCC 49987]|uniref:hypothetical protein n=1 Tax=Pseudarthrobacter sp. ATCC 49987 TaxID=2698204 RepID=UPI00136C8CA1|nr:hypothetical protein [Pseudarthrobacter sp. ATCC 49987]
MKLYRKGMLRAAISAAIIVVVLLIVGGNVFVTNQLIERNQPAVSITPGSPTKGDKGEKGDKGDRPTAQEVQQAVTDYCTSTGVCEGSRPSTEDVFAAVAKFCENNACRGNDGAAGLDGQNAPLVTTEQIASVVNTYCSDGRCRGADGINGLDGKDGVVIPMVWACVLRSDETTPAPLMTKQYESWKYANEPDEAYRDQFELSPGQKCVDPVDLRDAA